MNPNQVKLPQKTLYETVSNAYVNDIDIDSFISDLPKEKMYWVEESAWTKDNNRASLYPINEDDFFILRQNGFVNELHAIIPEAIHDPKNISKRVYCETYIESLAYKKFCTNNIKALIETSFSSVFPAASVLQKEIFVETIGKTQSMLDFLMDKLLDALGNIFAENARNAITKSTVSINIYGARNIDYMKFSNNFALLYNENQRILTEQYTNEINYFLDVFESILYGNVPMYNTNIANVMLKYINIPSEKQYVKNIDPNYILDQARAGYFGIIDYIFSDNIFIRLITPNTYFFTKFASLSSMENFGEVIVAREVNVIDEKTLLNNTLAASVGKDFSQNFDVPVMISVGDDDSVQYIPEKGMVTAEIHYRQFASPGLIFDSEYILDENN